MKGTIGVLAGVGVMGLAFWAYQENYRTQAAQREAAKLTREIGELRETLAMQRAEWAYLNRPERLEWLADLNFARLQLIPMLPDSFGAVDQVAYPPHPGLPPEGMAVTEPVEVAARGREVEG